jgi:hypothetical protein
MRRRTRLVDRVLHFAALIWSILDHCSRLQRCSPGGTSDSRKICDQMCDRSLPLNFATPSGKTLPGLDMRRNMPPNKKSSRRWS